MKECVFCQKPQKEIICENDLAQAFYDRYPVNRGHVLIIPKRHVETFFEATLEELTAINQLVFKVKNILEEKYKPQGYNIGFNVNMAGGQTIFHLHCHLIPRFAGDVENPRGGIRRIKKNLVPYPEEE